jgi:hypothetical protein
MGRDEYDRERMESIFSIQYSAFRSQESELILNIQLLKTGISSLPPPLGRGASLAKTEALGCWEDFLSSNTSIS